MIRVRVPGGRVPPEFPFYYSLIPFETRRTTVLPTKLGQRERRITGFSLSLLSALGIWATCLFLSISHIMCPSTVISAHLVSHLVHHVNHLTCQWLKALMHTMQEPSATTYDKVTAKQASKQKQT
jgi:type IV secretory pathway VirB3-like protein